MIFIAGGTGFIGSHLFNTLIEKGFKIKCLARNAERAQLCRAKGAEVSIGDITDAKSLKGVLNGCNTVIHLVGIIEEKGPITFQSVHVDGTQNLINEAIRAGVKQFFYQSALGADINSCARYHKTKAEAEEIVRDSGISYTIFRPSLIIGPGDGFTQKIREIIKKSPVIPIPGAGTAKFQPIFIGDWVRCFLKILNNPDSINMTYEFGGPEHLTYNEMVLEILDSMKIKKSLIHVPSVFAKFGVWIAERLLPSPPATVEQLRLLEKDNITDIESVRKNFGFEPIRFKEALKNFIISDFSHQAL